MAKKDTIAEAQTPVEDTIAEAQKPKGVKIKLFKDSDKYFDDVFVACNGHTLQIQRGVEVTVPKWGAEIIANAEEQRGHAADYIRERVNEYEEAVRRGAM